MCGEADPFIRIGEPERLAEVSGQEGVRRRLFRPDILIKASEYQPVSALQTGFQRPPDGKAWMVCASFADADRLAVSLEQLCPYLRWRWLEAVADVGKVSHGRGEGRAILTRPGQGGVAKVGHEVAHRFEELASGNRVFWRTQPRLCQPGLKIRDDTMRGSGEARRRAALHLCLMTRLAVQPVDMRFQAVETLPAAGAAQDVAFK